MASIMLVVGDSGNLTADETELKSIIEADGHSTVVHDDGDAPPAEHEDAVVWTANALDTAQIAAWKGEAVPLFVLQGARADDFGLCDLVGSTDPVTAIDIVDDTHPVAVAAGWSTGSLTLWTSGTRTRDSTVNVVDAAIIAEKISDTLDMLYTYDSGDELDDGTTAAEARACFPVHGNAGYATDGNANFAALIQETVNWLAPAGGGGGITLPLLHAIQES